MTLEDIFIKLVTEEEAAAAPEDESAS